MMYSGQHKLLDPGIPMPRKWRRREEMGGNRGGISSASNKVKKGSNRAQNETEQG